MSVEAYFDGLEGERRVTALAVRALLDDALPAATVDLAWGKPCWAGTARIASVIAHADHVNLQLWQGAALAARWPDRIEGTGKVLRHVKLPSASQVDDEVRAIIQAAGDLDGTNARRR